MEHERGAPRRHFPRRRYNRKDGVSNREAHCQFTQLPRAPSCSNQASTQPLPLPLNPISATEQHNNRHQQQNQSPLSSPLLPFVRATMSSDGSAQRGKRSAQPSSARRQRPSNARSCVAQPSQARALSAPPITFLVPLTGLTA